MSAMLLRILIFVVIAGAVFLGARKIWRDWKNQFQAVDAERRKRDLSERKRTDVIELKRDKDGTYRPDGE